MFYLKNPIHPVIPVLNTAALNSTTIQSPVRVPSAVGAPLGAAVALTLVSTPGCNPRDESGPLVPIACGITLTLAGLGIWQAAKFWTARYRQHQVFQHEMRAAREVSTASVTMASQPMSNRQTAQNIPGEAQHQALQQPHNLAPAPIWLSRHDAVSRLFEEIRQLIHKPGNEASLETELNNLPRDRSSEMWIQLINLLYRIDHQWHRLDDYQSIYCEVLRGLGTVDLKLEQITPGQSFCGRIATICEPPRFQHIPFFMRDETIVQIVIRPCLRDTTSGDTVQKAIVVVAKNMDPLSKTSGTTGND